MESKFNTLTAAVRTSNGGNTADIEARILKEIQTCVTSGERKWVQDALKHEAEVQEARRAQLVEVLQESQRRHAENLLNKVVEEKFAQLMQKLPERNSLPNVAEMRADIEASMAAVQAMQFQEGLQALRQQFREELKS